METSYQELRKKDTINLVDGKRLGKVCDVVFTFPEGNVLGIVVPGGKGFHWGKGEMFIDLKQIKKIGIDVILVELKCAAQQEPKPDKCRPPRDQCPSPCPPPRPPYPPRGDRRDYGEYE